MKKGAMCVALSIATISVCAQTVQDDSLLVKHLDEVEVIATRATKTTPVAFTNITKQEIQKRNYGQDLPYLLSPSGAFLMGDKYIAGYLGRIDRSVLF